MRVAESAPAPPGLLPAAPTIAPEAHRPLERFQALHDDVGGPFIFFAAVGDDTSKPKIYVCSKRAMTCLDERQAIES